MLTIHKSVCLGGGGGGLRKTTRCVVAYNVDNYGRPLSGSHASLFLSLYSCVLDVGQRRHGLFPQEFELYRMAVSSVDACHICDMSVERPPWVCTTPDSAWHDMRRCYMFSVTSRDSCVLGTLGLNSRTHHRLLCGTTAHKQYQEIK